MRIRYLATFIAAALLCPALVYGDETKSVIVKNTPLPVTGSVSLSTSGPVPVSGTVGAAQSGSWNVGISGPVTTVPAEDPTKNAFQVALLAGRCYTVPSGKRAVVEFGSISADVQVSNPPPTATFPAAGGITATLDGTGAGHSIPFTQSIQNNIVDSGFGAIPMRAYADPDTQICASIFKTAPTAIVLQLTVTISGHLVSVP